MIEHTLADKLDPRCFPRLSPKTVAYVLGGEADLQTGPAIVGLTIRPDGLLFARHDVDPGHEELIGTLPDFNSSWPALVALAT